MSVRLDMMQGELTNALIDALQETGNDIEIEETVGGMVLIRATTRLSISRQDLEKAAGYKVSVAELNALTVAIVGHTKFWTDEGFEISEE